MNHDIWLLRDSMLRTENVRVNTFPTDAILYSHPVRPRPTQGSGVAWFLRERALQHFYRPAVSVRIYITTLRVQTYLYLSCNVSYCRRHSLASSRASHSLWARRILLMDVASP